MEAQKCRIKLPGSQYQLQKINETWGSVTVVQQLIDKCLMLKGTWHPLGKQLNYWLPWDAHHLAGFVPSLQLNHVTEQ